MSINIFIILTVAIANLVLGSLIYSRNRRLISNKIFLGITIFLTLWMLCNFFLQQTGGNTRIADVLNAAAYSFGFMAIYLSFLFANSYPVVSNLIKIRWRLITASVLAIVFALFSATEYIAGSVYINSSGAVDFVTGQYENIYTFVVIMLVILMITHYLMIIKSSKGAEKAQAVLIMIALSSSILIGVAANLVLPLMKLQIDYVYFSPITSLVVISFIAYAITRHGLFDVRPFITRSVAYSFSIVALLGVFLFIALFALRSLVGSELQLSQTVFFAILSVILAIMFQPTKKYFDKISNNIFYRDSYNPQEVINNINSRLVNTSNLEDLLNNTAELIENELNLTFCDFYLDPKASIHFHLAGSNSKLFANSAWVDFLGYFSGINHKVAAINDTDLPIAAKQSMAKLDISAAIKMRSAGDDVGFVMVGDRKSGNSFTSQDLQLLEIIADEVAIAVQNSLRYEEISQFNLTLQKKINEATAELQKSNEKLKALDEAKDEFISMASHQLRTPLTSVKGYLSMILEGDAGEINESQRQFLNQAYISSQRMVYLIADLLNVSRLRTGKFIIETKPTYLPDIVNSEVSQLLETAKSRELALKFNKPDDFPTLNLDETKIRQVIMNFIDNAIYYTPKGGKISVDLTKTKESIEYTVTDTGIGVPKADQHKLFTKFYRAGNAKNARPDGTGLGLFMAKKVVIAQGGAMIFKTQEGKGSTFGFSFPRNKTEVKDTEN